MDLTDMSDKERRGQGRIPVRFVDEEGRGPQEEATAEQRPDRADEEDRAAADAAGPSQEASEPARGGEAQEQAPARPESADKDDEEPERRPNPSSGPVMAELLATRSELRRVEGELKKAADERADLAEKLARRQADYDNFRKRTERERKEIYGRALGDVVGRLLPVLDNLQRALDAERTVQAGESEDFRHFVRGIELIGKQLAGALESMGVEVVPTVGERFDPHVHEAVATEESDEFEPDTVMQEMQRGYRLGDKLLRPAMVKVAK